MRPRRTSSRIAQSTALVVLACCLGWSIPALGTGGHPGQLTGAQEAEPQEVKPPAAETPSAIVDGIAWFGTATMDVLVIRPLALVATAVGACLFVPAAAMSVAEGKDSRDQVLSQFVLQSWNYAITRDIGDL